MRIVNREEFLKLPENTIFCKYTPCYFAGLECKGDSGEWNPDYLTCDLVAQVKCDSSDDYFNIVDKASKDGSPFELDVDFYGRDGLYDESQLFAIYEKNDILQLIEKLKSCL